MYKQPNADPDVQDVSWIDVILEDDSLSILSMSNSMELSLVQDVALLKNLVLTDALELKTYTDVVETVSSTGWILRKEIFKELNTSIPSSVLTPKAELKALNHCLKS